MRNIFIICFLQLFVFANAQPKKASLYQILGSAQVKHPLLQNARLKSIHPQYPILAAMSIAPAKISYMQGAFFSSATDQYFEIQQSLGSPYLWAKQYVVNTHEAELFAAKQQLVEKQTVANIKATYYKSVYMREKYFLLKALRDSLAKIADENNILFNNSDTFVLENVLALQHVSEISSETEMAYNEMIMSENNLVQAAYLDVETIPADTTLELFQIVAASDTSTRTPARLQTKLLNEKSLLAEANFNLEKSKFWPQFYAGYFTHSINGKKGFNGWEAGISLPIWYFGQDNATRKAKLEMVTTGNEIKYQLSLLEATSANLLTEMNKYFERLNFYYNGALERAEKIETNAKRLFDSKQISIEKYISIITTAYRLRLGYLEALDLYNQKAIELEVYAY